MSNICVTGEVFERYVDLQLQLASKIPYEHGINEPQNVIKFNQIFTFRGILLIFEAKPTYNVCDFSCFGTFLCIAAIYT